MSPLLKTPLEDAVGRWWHGLDSSVRQAFFWALAVNVLAFGFEMTNLTLNHDDVIQIFIQDTILGHYLGRFGEGWLHYYVQNHYFMPFLQLSEGIVAMSIYGVLVARLWGATRTLDIALIAAILSVFPYMAQVYQYNTAMATYSTAHLLAAAAVACSVRGTVRYVVLAAILYAAAFSIYQAVAANAATIFVVWLLSRRLEPAEAPASPTLRRAVVAAILAVAIGGALYLGAVWSMHLENDPIHDSEEAFELKGASDFSQTLPTLVQGTRSFFLWPETYFPEYLKLIQLALMALAMLLCAWVPKRGADKLIACALFAAAIVAPRSLQLLHPKGHFHNLTLTAYAVVIAAAVLVIRRARYVFARNLATIAGCVLVGGYVIQSNWISTVAYLNTLAHVSTLTQVLAKIRAIPDAQWDGRKIAVVGSYAMAPTYPFRPATGIATSFMDANHMDLLARLLRDDAQFVAADQTMPKVLEFATQHRPWPDPGSVGIVDGVGVVVFSKPKTP